jgi:hypothetical protein
MKPSTFRFDVLLRALDQHFTPRSDPKQEEAMNGKPAKSCGTCENWGAPKRAVRGMLYPCNAPFDAQGLIRMPVCVRITDTGHDHGDKCLFHVAMDRELV